MERYLRQMKLPQIGKEGQEKLKNAVVAVIGAGGLGCPVLTYLAEAGVGHIRIIDCDEVNLTNLNRQFLHGEPDIGRKKALSAAESMRYLNSEINIEPVCDYLTEENTQEFLENADVVIDCVDNIKTRLLVNEVCLRNRIPLVEGGITGFYGFVTDILPEYACLSCLGYKESMDKEEIPAIGACAGVIGALQAAEALKILLGAGKPLYGKILQYDGLLGSFDEIEIYKRDDCALHKRAEKARSK